MYHSAAIAGTEIPRLSNRTRFVRIATAVVLAGLAGVVEPAWPMWIGAAGFFFSAVHDRCPLMQALRARFRPVPR